MAESFTCPVCGATSHNPNDVREGYCGRCHDWTAGPGDILSTGCTDPSCPAPDGTRACDDDEFPGRPCAAPTSARRLPPYRDDHLHVVAEKCATCVFRPGNPMHLQPGRVRELVADNLAADAALVCHKTLPYGDHPEVGEAICRGFWDGPFADHPTRRLAEVLGVVEEVTLP